MTRARVAFAAAFAATALFGSILIAGQQAPQLPTVLAGKKFTPPVKGEAVIEYTAPKTARKGDSVVTAITVRNLSPAPIARLTVNEIWYQKDGSVLTAGRAVINGLLQPREVQTMEIATPWKAGMGSFQRRFTHANGDVKLNLVKSLDAPKDASAAPATKK
jgi:hypothetical protein